MFFILRFFFSKDCKTLERLAVFLASFFARVWLVGVCVVFKASWSLAFKGFLFSGVVAAWMLLAFKSCFWLSVWMSLRVFGSFLVSVGAVGFLIALLAWLVGVIGFLLVKFVWWTLEVTPLGFFSFLFKVSLGVLGLVSLALWALCWVPWGCCFFVVEPIF